MKKNLKWKKPKACFSGID